MPDREDSLNSSDEDVYHVEVITKARVNDDAEWEYLVSWAGYSSDEDSWEPAENVEQCDRLLNSFWRHVGMDDEDYAPGDECKAEPWWIKRERAYFAKLWGKKQQQKKRKKASRDRHYSFTISGSKNKKESKDHGKDLAKFVQQQNGTDESYDDSDDSDEVPLSQVRAPKGKRRSASNQRVQSPDESGPGTDKSDSESESDVPVKGKRTGGKPATSRTLAAQSSKTPAKGTKRRLSSSEPAGDEEARPLNGPPRKLSKTSSIPVMQSNLVVQSPTTPSRRNTNTHQDSPSSLFSAPPSPAPPSPLKSGTFPIAAPVPTAPRSNVAEPPKKGPPPKPPAGQSKAVRKPAWLITTRKVKLIDAPNLKASSTLPTKARLFANAKPPDAQQPLTPGRRDSVQTLPDLSTFQPVPSNSMDPPPAPVQPPVVREIPRQPPAAIAEAEAFLNDIMPTELAEPMIDGMEQNRPAPIRKQSTAELLRNTTIPKKFKWSGELYINTTKGQGERICNVLLSDSTDGPPERLRFSICYNASVSLLRLEKLFTLVELDSLRPALLSPSEIAKLGPESDTDAQPLATLYSYMTSRKLVSCSSVFLDDNNVALLLVFPTSIELLCNEFNLRSEFRRPNQFVAALHPWKVVGKKAHAHRLYRSPSDRDHHIYRAPADLVVPANRGRSLRQKASCHRALIILGFPKWLHDELKPGYPYCVWNKGGDGSPSEPGFESRLLKHVLDERRARDVGYKADVDTIFVHVGAVRSLAGLPALMERRMRRPDIQFVTYGTHHTVPPARWGMRLIYPMGGIITISPSIFAECPSTVYKLLDMLEQHPLWDCFVTPAVVALAARQTRGNPISEFEKGALIHQDLLSRIAQGQLSLLRQVPPYGAKRNPLEEWVGWQQELSMLDPRGILELSLRSFSQQFSDLPEEKWHTAALDELSRTLSSLQQQPCIVDQYRRFVVIVGQQEKVTPDRDAHEWTSIVEHNFRDDFFSKDEMNDFRAWAGVEQAIHAAGDR
ncbi:hypothetical protein BC834DRAFT_860173 [Gloeopeniophorella convolvens]|nr:hypothetical protein BC834DRAFT_860173 [Gloeopeniophorella convolvens]